ncbi:MAG: outer membrane lipoprotein-sorting protein [Bacteroidia bacterium]|jgi:outer membrane lipoprotein-sorting protein
MTKKITIFLLLLSAAAASFSFMQAEPTAAEIIKKAQDRLNGETTQATIKISIIRPKWSRTMGIKSWSKGTKYAMTLITDPDRDKGTVFLKRDREAWNWVPAVERVIKLPPSMMSQSWMGTDLTNDDLVKESSIEDDYTHIYNGKETVNGRECYKLTSIPTESAAVVWGKVVSWIDTKDYIQMKTEFFDEDEELVNTFNATAIKVLGGKTLASKLEIIPADKPGQKTIMEYISLVFDQPISDDFFTVQNMKKVK